MIKRFSVLLGLIACLGVACGGESQVFDLQGGSEMGNPPDEYRQVTGFVPWARDVAIQGLSLGGVPCSADPIIVADLNGSERRYMTESDCSFSFYVRTGQFYSIELDLGNDTAIPLMFGKEISEDMSPYIKIGQSEAVVDFGKIRFETLASGLIAVPEYIPELNIDFSLNIPMPDVTQLEPPELANDPFNTDTELDTDADLEPIYYQGVPYQTTTHPLGFNPPKINFPKPFLPVPPMI